MEMSKSIPESVEVLSNSIVNQNEMVAVSATESIEDPVPMSLMYPNVSLDCIKEEENDLVMDIGLNSQELPSNSQSDDVLSPNDLYAKLLTGNLFSNDDDVDFNECHNEEEETYEKDDLDLDDFYKSLGEYQTPKPFVRDESAPTLKFTCPMCPYQTNVKGTYMNHLPTHSKEKPFACESCDRRFTSKRLLTDHSKIHAKTKQFACNICSFQTHRHQHYKNHMQTHTGEKPFGCVLCSFRTNLKSTLKRHMETHSPLADTYRCDECSYVTHNRSCLYTHKKVHIDFKQFSCDMCPYSTKKLYNLKKHKEKHTKVLKYKCDFCSYGAHTKCHLVRHLKAQHASEPTLLEILTLIQTIKCDFCPYRSKDLYTVRQHMLSHKGNKIFRCKHCSFGADSKVTVIRHTKRHHGEEDSSVITAVAFNDNATDGTNSVASFLDETTLSAMSSSSSTAKSKESIEQNGGSDSTISPTSELTFINNSDSFSTNGSNDGPTIDSNCLTNIASISS